MKDKQVIIPSAAEIRRWIKVKLKERLSYGLLPRLSDLLREYDGAIFSVLEIGKDAMNVCTCKKAINEHAPDCLTHPHPMVCVIDPNDENNMLEIRSLFLEPVELREEVKDQVMQIEKKYSLVTFSSDGLILCEDACLSKNPEFVFLKDSGEWLYGDSTAKVGDIVFLEEDMGIFMAVIEADFEQLRCVMFSYELLLQKIIKKKIVAKILED